MDLLMLLLFGAVVGWVTSLIVKTNASQGVIGDIVLGILGALTGGFVMNLFGEPGVTGFNLYSIVVGVLGAVIFVIIGRSIMGMISTR